MAIVLYLIIFIIVVNCIIIQIRFQPKLEIYRNDLVIWYNTSKYSKDKDYIIIKKL